MLNRSFTFDKLLLTFTAVIGLGAIGQINEGFAQSQNKSVKPKVTKNPKVAKEKVTNASRSAKPKVTNAPVAKGKVVKTPVVTNRLPDSARDLKAPEADLLPKGTVFKPISSTKNLRLNDTRVSQNPVAPVDSAQESLLPLPYVVLKTPNKSDSTPGSTITSPTAFGAQWQDVFGGVSYQGRTRFTNLSDGAFVVGFGLGDRRESVGLEVAIASVSTIRQGIFKNGSISAKLHRALDDSTAVAVGVENVLPWGGTDGGTSVYGVATKVFRFTNSPDEAFSSLTTTLGLGTGRFRSQADVTNNTGSVNVFGSAGLRVFRPVSVIADWSGQTLGLGMSIVPFRDVPLSINPAVVDVTNGAGDGARFTMSVGYALKF
jgi:hypothetical protein